MEDKVFKQFKARLLKESWLKSIICGLTAGFIALLISCTVFWFVGFKAVWVGAIIALLICAVCAPIFFYTVFRPTDKALARRMDSLGLDERIITMKELYGNESFIAKRQREDAIAAISKVDAKLIKIAVSVPLFVALGVSALLGSGMTVVSALAASDIIRSGNEIIEDITKPEIKLYTVSYETEGAGYIVGDIVQLVEAGGTAETVLAVAEEGFYFDHWIAIYIGADGNEYEIENLTGYDNPTRQDSKIDKDITFIAVFMETQDEDDGSGMGSGEGDSDSGIPGMDGEGDGQGKSPEVGNSQDPSSGASGAYNDDVNQVIDGDTYFGGDTLDNARNDAMESIDDNDSEKGTIGDYFDLIKD